MRNERDLILLEQMLTEPLDADGIIRLLDGPTLVLVTEDGEIDDDACRLDHKIKMVLGRVPVRELILALVKSPDPDARDYLCYLLGKRKAKSAVPALIPQLDAESWELRNSAAEALMKIGGQRAGEALLRRFEGWEPVRGARRTLALALGECGCREAIPALIRALKDPDFPVRGWAAYSLGRLRAAEALDAIKAACKSEPAYWAAGNMYEAIALLGGVADFSRDPYFGPPLSDPPPPEGIDLIEVPAEDAD